MQVERAGVDVKPATKWAENGGQGCSHMGRSNVCHSKSGGQLLLDIQAASVARQHEFLNFRFPHHIFFVAFIYDDPEFPLAWFWSYYKYKSLRSSLPSSVCVSVCVRVRARYGTCRDITHMRFLQSINVSFLRRDQPSEDLYVNVSKETVLETRATTLLHIGAK